MRKKNYAEIVWLQSGVETMDDKLDKFEEISNRRTDRSPNDETGADRNAYNLAAR